MSDTLLNVGDPVPAEAIAFLVVPVCVGGWLKAHRCGRSVRLREARGEETKACEIKIGHLERTVAPPSCLNSLTNGGRRRTRQSSE
jgi:hypothetical protein